MNLYHNPHQSFHTQIRRYKVIEELKRIFDQLQATSGRIDKENIIKANANNELFKKVLVFLLDNNITTGISTIRINKEMNQVPIEYQKLNTLEECLNYISLNNTGSYESLYSVQQFIKSCPKETQDMVKLLVTKSLKLGIDAKTVNKVIPNLIKTFSVMLGTSIEKCKIKNGDWFSISHKLNGSRCVFYRGEFYTRQGKKYCGLDHIKNDLQKVLVNPNVVVDGELVYKNAEGLSDSAAFQVGVGIANSKAETKPELKLIIFDMLSVREFDNGKSDNTYKTRKADLEATREVIENLNFENISVVDTFYEGTDQSQIWKWLDYAEVHDLEGVMVNLDAPYECKRSKNLIKVKKFYTMDLEVIGYEEGTGRLSGTLGALIVDYKGNKVNVGSGFDDNTRKEIWSNRSDIIGRVIELKYKEISKDKKTGLESLQFPIFLCIRELGKEVNCE